MRRIFLFPVAISLLFSGTPGEGRAAFEDGDFGIIATCSVESCASAAREALVAISALPAGVEKDAVIVSYVKAVTEAGQKNHSVASELSAAVYSAADQMTDGVGAGFVRNIASALYSCNISISGSCDQIDTAAVAPGADAPTDGNFGDFNAS